MRGCARGGGAEWGGLGRAVPVRPRPAPTTHPLCSLTVWGGGRPACMRAPAPAGARRGTGKALGGGSGEASQRLQGQKLPKQPRSRVEGGGLSHGGEGDGRKRCDGERKKEIKREEKTAETDEEVSECGGPASWNEISGLWSGGRLKETRGTDGT